MSGPEHIIPFDELPERFARALAHPPATPATPRPAATVVLMRDAEEGVEVLLLRRSRRSGFVPGAYVFPGGRVDAADAAPGIVRHLDGLDAEAAARRLGLAGGDPPALAYYLAALREAFEETGILVGTLPDGGPPPTAEGDPAVDALRNDLMEERQDFAAVLDRMEVRLDGGALEYLAHWITPEPEPRRYDTRFFAARVPTGARAIIDRREMTDALWATPRGALLRFREGELPMIFPTIKTLEQLAGYGSVEEALRKIGALDVPTILPRLVLTPEGLGMEVD